MRQTIKTDRAIELLVPVWYTKAERQFDRLDYNQPMVKFTLPPGEYNCEQLERWIIRGADVNEEDQMYLAKLGFVPGMVAGDYIEDVTTGLDPEEEMN